MITKEEQIKNPAKAVATTGLPKGTPASGVTTQKPKKKPEKTFEGDGKTMLAVSGKIGEVAKDTADYWKKNPSPMFSDIKGAVKGAGMYLTDKADSVHDYVFGKGPQKDVSNSPFMKPFSGSAALDNPFKPPVSPVPDITFAPKDHTQTLGTFNGKPVTNNPVTGMLSLNGSPVKEAGFIRSEAAKTLPGVPQGSNVPGIGARTPGGDVARLLDMETGVMTSSMSQPSNPGSFFGAKGAPQEGDRAYRDLEKNITDLTNQQKALTSGNYSPSAFGTLSPGQRMNYAAQLGEQIKGMQDTLFNRSSLANDIVKALIGAQSAQGVAGTAADAELKKAQITGQYGVAEAGVTASGAQATAGQKRTDDLADKQVKNQISATRGALSEMRQLQSNGDSSPELQKKIDDALAVLISLGVNEDDDEDYTVVPGPVTK